MVTDAEREVVILSIAALAEELNRQVQDLRRFVLMLQESTVSRGAPDG